MEDIWERIELAIGRMEEICDETWSNEDFDEKDICLRNNLKDFFDKTATFFLYLYDVYEIEKDSLSEEELKSINAKLYEDIVGENYDESYANPDYAALKLGTKYGKLLSFLYSEVRACIAYIYENKMSWFVATAELFLQIYSMLKDELTDSKYIKEAIYYHMYDYADIMVAGRTLETIDSSNTFATDIIMKSELTDMRYLYKYGEYITDNEIKTAQFLNKLSEDDVKAMAATYVDGFIRGFETMRIDIKPKKTVNIRYSIGQERMVKYAIKMFEENGLSPVIFRYATGRINRKLTIRTGYIGTPANKQYEYDHRMDEAIFLDKDFVTRKLEVIEETYEKHKELAKVYAGPAVIETFGEDPFKPAAKDTINTLDSTKQELSVKYASKAARITNKYIPRDSYSFTIIAYPIPEIGDNFEEIFAEIVKVNTLDNNLYRGIQQAIIDELDLAKYVHVLGKGDNKTDIKVMLHTLDNKDKQTNFENCLADVNIPLGEVFTSPILTNTEGVLNVSQVYLNELKYTNLMLTFKDGKISSYTCDNFEKEDENKAFIKENLMFNHETLPIGEFAIGTNTTAYVMAQRFDILYKLPILIVEKMGPHFAVGDTCYSYSEDSPLYNPDGKEIIARDNECSLLRRSDKKENQEKAYFNCHTDITIPYEEIAGIYSVHEDGSKVSIIENGRFVLPGTDKLNEPFEK